MPSRYFRLHNQGAWYCDDGVQCFPIPWEQVRINACTQGFAVCWPYTWTHTSGAWGHAESADPLTRTEWLALLAKWNAAGKGHWQFKEGHIPCA